MARNRESEREAHMRRAELHRGNPSLTRIVERNIRRITQLRKAADESRSMQERVSDAITKFSGSMAFVYLHAVFFIVWIWVNLALGPKRALDPYPFSLLTLVVSLEAIFLSTFVLVSQNRMQATSDDRDDLDLQVDLLAEYEITRSLRLIRAMAEKMGISEADDPELEELGQAIKPQTILREIGTQVAKNTSQTRPDQELGDNI
jgi:uncharacterized membrane protein